MGREHGVGINRFRLVFNDIGIDGLHSERERARAPGQVYWYSEEGLKIIIQYKYIIIIYCMCAYSTGTHAHEYIGRYTAHTRI